MRTGAKEAQGRARETPPEDGEPVPIVLVDDQTAVLRAQKLLLERHGYRVETADSGAATLALVETFTPKAVLLDLSLGDMNGDELLVRLKRCPQWQGCLFICVSGWPAQDVNWRQMGFDHYLQKPATTDQIDRLLKRD